MLNGRVRDGNGCGHPGVRTGKGRGPAAGPKPAAARCIERVAVRAGLCVSALGVSPGGGGASPSPFGPGGGVKAAKRSAVSTGRLRRSPAVHLRPIDPVVCREPSPTRGGRPRLAGGFTLRCLQRLSGPYVATQRCRERDNWHTRGTSLPVLSY